MLSHQKRLRLSPTLRALVSEPVDLSGMTPEQASRAVRAAARTMEIPKRRGTPPTIDAVKKPALGGAKPKARKP